MNLTGIFEMNVDEIRSVSFANQDRSHTNPFCCLQVVARVLDHDALLGGCSQFVEDCVVGFRKWFWLIASNADVIYFFEHIFNTQRREHPICVTD